MHDDKKTHMDFLLSVGDYDKSMEAKKPDYEKQHLVNFGVFLFTLLEVIWKQIETPLETSHKRRYDIFEYIKWNQTQSDAMYLSTISRMRLMLFEVEKFNSGIGVDTLLEEDIKCLKETEKSYGSSWKKRGGVGAFMMLARKWDRIVIQTEKHNKNILHALREDKRQEGIIDDIRDLRRYLMLIYAEMLRWAHYNIDDDGRAFEEVVFEKPISFTSKDIQEKPSVCSHENMHGNIENLFCVDCGVEIKVSIRDQ